MLIGLGDFLLSMRLVIASHPKGRCARSVSSLCTNRRMVSRITHVAGQEPLQMLLKESRSMVKVWRDLATSNWASRGRRLPSYRLSGLRHVPAATTNWTHQKQRIKGVSRFWYLAYRALLRCDCEGQSLLLAVNTFVVIVGRAAICLCKNTGNTHN